MDGKTLEIRNAKNMSSNAILDALDVAGFDIRSRNGINYAWSGDDCTFSQGNEHGYCDACGFPNKPDGCCSRSQCCNSD